MANTIRLKIRQMIYNKTIEIEELEKEIKVLEAKIRDAKIYIEALEECKRLCAERKRVTPK